MGIRRGLLVAVLVCAAAAPAHAISEDDERAKAHFLAGQSYYDQASYTDALREFNEAYRISKRPALLYNVARCYEALDQYDEAVKMLQRYLDEDPETTDRAAVETRIANLRGRRVPPSRGEPDVGRPPPPRAPPVVQPQPPSAPPPPPAPHRKRVATWVVGGVGVGLLAAALGTGVAAQVDYNDLSGACMANRCDPSEQKKIDSGKCLALATDVLWPIGAAAVVTGVVLFFVEGRAHKKELAVARDR